MTMQVGMTGKDGVLIASDTHYANNKSAVRPSWNSTKFKIDHELGIAISCAMNMETAESLADEIIAATRQNKNWLFDSSDLDAIPRISKKVLDPAEKGRERAQCLVVFMRPTPELWHFQTVMDQKTKEWFVRPDSISTKVYAGDTANPAIFWIERYYRDMREVLIANLVPLAAHLIVTAGVLNSAGISGLEIVLCDHAGIHRLPDESIRELERQSKERDKSIGESLISAVSSF